MRNLTILGSTGSIGQQAIEVIKRFPNKFRVIGLSARKNISLLAKQIRELKPRKVVVTDLSLAKELKRFSLLPRLEVLSGEEGLVALSSWDKNDIVLNALVGAVGLDSTLAVIEKGKRLALANKESLVSGGELVIRYLKKSQAEMIPIDSEHSALFQCLLGEKKEEISRLIITGSGGPFRGKKLSQLKDVSVEEALAHPRWKMGKKITIDSATLMNKGLEVIEAHFLFGLNYEQIKVVIHPQSIIHSMIEFKDGSVKAHLGPTDMRIPIQYALTYPEREDAPVPFLNLPGLNLTFEEPDLENFPCLAYALEAARKGDTFPAVLNASNEIAVYAFLEGKIPFTGISKVICDTLEKHNPLKIKGLAEVKEADRWARKEAIKIVNRWRE